MAFSFAWWSPPDLPAASCSMPNVSFSNLQLGGDYSRQQLAVMWNYRAYQAIARGVVTPARHSSIILFVTREKQRTAQKYEDRLEGNRLYWEGPTDHFAEKRIVNAVDSGDEIHLFYRDRHHSEFRYYGPLRLLEADTRLTSPSSFVFTLASEAFATTPPEATTQDRLDTTIRISRLWHQPLEQLRRKAFAQEASKSGARSSSRKAYPRSEVIKVYVRRRAKGRCEGCGAPAPFFDFDGIPYLEPHHVERLADDGLDHPLCVIALCPNCHTRVHRGADGREYNLLLTARIPTLEPLPV